VKSSKFEEPYYERSVSLVALNNRVTERCDRAVRILEVPGTNLDPETGYPA